MQRPNDGAGGCGRLDEGTNDGREACDVVRILGAVDGGEIERFRREAERFDDGRATGGEAPEDESSVIHHVARVHDAVGDALAAEMLDGRARGAEEAVG